MRKISAARRSWLILLGGISFDVGVKFPVLPFLRR